MQCVPELSRRSRVLVQARGTPICQAVESTSTSIGSGSPARVQASLMISTTSACQASRSSARDVFGNRSRTTGVTDAQVVDGPIHVTFCNINGGDGRSSN